MRNCYILNVISICFQHHYSLFFSKKFFYFEDDNIYSSMKKNLHFYNLNCHLYSLSRETLASQFEDSKRIK